MIKVVKANRETSRKSVFGSHDQTAHVWAQNIYTSGRASDGRMFWEGATLFSYGRHFALGHVLETTAGRVYILNSDNYSVSTGKHKTLTWRAVAGTAYFVPGLTDIVHSLDGLTYPGDSDFAAERRANAAACVLQYVERRILDMPEDSARFLLEIAGRPRAFDMLKRKAEKLRDKRLKEQKAREIESRKRDAENAASLSDSDFEAFIARRIDNPAWIKARPYEGAHYTTSRRAMPSETVAAIATELHRYNVTAKAHCGKRVQAILKARLKSTRATAKHLATLEKRSADLAQFNRYKATFRQVMATAAIDAMEKHNAETIVRLTTFFCSKPKIRGALAEKLMDLCERASQRVKAAEEEARRERFEKERQAREDWINGKTGLSYNRYSDENGRALLRAVKVERDESGNITAGTLETSHGANVPLVDAIKAFRFVKLIRERGTAWKRNGATLPVGHFQVDAIEPSGSFVAGCHKIGWNEIERIARALDVLDMPAADTTNHGAH